MPASTSQMLYYLIGVKKRVTSGPRFRDGLKKHSAPRVLSWSRRPRQSVELDPKARRSSLYFDELLPIDDDEFEDEHQPEDIKIDTYIERLENGHRAKPIPPIAKFL